MLQMDQQQKNQCHHDYKYVAITKIGKDYNLM